MNPPERAQLLDSFPLLRSRIVEEARERIGHVFSPHRLELRGDGLLDARHNQVRLRDVSLHVLGYGAEVAIDPGERGDFYLAQLPLGGSAQLVCGRQQVQVDAGVLSILQPKTRSRMVWSGDCSMILVQVPRTVVHARAAQWGQGTEPQFSLAYSRSVPDVAAWWQAVADLTDNIDRFGGRWLSHPAAYGAMEEFLLSAFTALLGEAGPVPRMADRGDERCLRRAKEYVHANVGSALTLAEMARHACVCPRTLEAVFKRYGEPPPLAYARGVRLQAVHDALRLARQEGRMPQITELALSHGFLHMGRFAAQYKARFGSSPSATLRRD